ncbi:MAG: hypothetical protein ACRDYA_18165 [Egibacteraceae bacterium]
MQRRSKVLITLVAVAVVVMGMIGIGVASADESRSDCGGGWQEKRAELADAVGEKLGVSGDEVLSAVRAVRDDKLDQAVEDGKITQEQADRIRDRFEEGAPRQGGPQQGGPGRCGPPGHWGTDSMDSKESAE